MLQSKEQDNNSKIGRLVIVSNRLPVVLTKDDDGQWQVEPGSGGLVTALAPVLRDRGGLWIGWPGTLEEVLLNQSLAAASRGAGYVLIPIMLTEEEVEGYYFGFSNRTLWPLFHNLQSHCSFEPSCWHTYQMVNRKFAEVIAENVRADDFIWVHDYHLMLVAKELREIGVESKIGFFLHIPFPPLDIYAMMPWRWQIMAALSDYDIIGFQTMHDRNNFIRCVETWMKGLHVDARRRVCTIEMPQRQVRVGAFPVSIDFKEFARQAALESTAKRATQLYDDVSRCEIILGVDRLDYSKGIPQRLMAFRNALERFDDLLGKVVLAQIVVPSREDVPEYQDLKAEIEGLVSEINGKFSRSGWIPIHHMFRSLERAELLAYYRAAGVALITPLNDGMNLVAKEYCAANVDNSGTLILSEFAGAASQLGRNALVVNPHDVEGVANAIHRACNTSLSERQSRMRKLRRSVAKRDIFWWLDFFLWAALTRELGNHPSSAILAQIGDS
ncbi:trehalose-6-phosphate synthase [Chloroflexota bacterium]